MAGELLIIALMGGLCTLFVFMFIRTIRNKANGAANAIRVVRLAVFTVCALWFGYVFVNLLIALPRILAG